MRTLADLQPPDDPAVLLECVSGSRAYGTATPESDEDIRGIFAIARAEDLALAVPPAQVSDDRSNIVFYSLRRTIELLADANPNILELVYMPADCVRRPSLAQPVDVDASALDRLLVGATEASGC
jgi:predicted nucleotidyltransferase